MTSKFPDTTSSPNIFDVVFVLIVKFSYSSKFHVNIITSSWIMTISFIRNPEIENTSVWVLPNIWKLGRIRNTKLSKSISNDMLLNTAKFQGYSFYRFWVIKEKPTRGVKFPLNPQSGQTQSNNSLAIRRRIVWLYLTILWSWRWQGWGYAQGKSTLNHPALTQSMRMDIRVVDTLN